MKILALLLTFCFAFSAFADKDSSKIHLTSFTAKSVGSAPALKPADFKGHVVLVDFWASWCGPCKEALPHYDAFYKKYKAKGLMVLGINEDEVAKDRDDFLKRFPVSFPIYEDVGTAMTKSFDVTALPALFIFDKKGKAVSVLRGFDEKNAATLEKKIQELLK